MNTKEATDIQLPAHLNHAAPDAYLVGGAVRDLVTGRQPTDYDVVVNGDPERFAGLLAQRSGGRVVVLNKDRFALFRIVGQKAWIDVTAMEKHGIESDLLSRDFTINALACRLDHTRVIDYTGGLEDLARRTIRMVSVHNLQTDPVRMIRAYRIASDLGYGVDLKTRHAIQQYASGIQTTAGERIWTEFQLILKGANSHRRISDMAKDGLLDALFPELAALRRCTQNRHHAYDAFSHTLAAYHCLENILMQPERYMPTETATLVHALNSEDRLCLKMGLLLHDIGKPLARGRNTRGDVHFHGHASTGAEMTERVCRRLRVPNRVTARVAFIIRHHQRPLSLFLNRSDKALGRFYRLCAEQTPLILLHAIAGTMGKSPRPEPDKAASIDFFTSLLNAYHLKIRQALQGPRLLSGKDLVAHFALPPSPLFHTLLNAIEEARLAGLITDKKAALQWIEHYLHDQKPDAP